MVGPQYPFNQHLPLVQLAKGQVSSHLDLGNRFLGLERDFFNFFFYQVLWVKREGKGRLLNMDIILPSQTCCISFPVLF